MLSNIPLHNGTEARCALPSVRMERSSAVLLLRGYSLFEIQLDIFRPGTGKPRVPMGKQEALSLILLRGGGAPLYYFIQSTD